MILDITDLEYHARPELSSGQLAYFIESSPRVFWLSGCKKPFTTTTASAVGSAVHRLVLEPHRPIPQLVPGLQDSIAYIDARVNPRTKKYKEQTDGFPGTVLGAKEMELATSVSMEILSSCAFRTLWDNRLENYTEAAISFTHDGIPCRAKPDLVGRIRDTTILCDLKTLDAFSDQKVRQRWYDGWWVQAAFYILALRAEGLDVGRVCYAVATRAKPCRFEILEIPEQRVSVALERVTDALKEYKKCLESNTWPGSGDSVRMLQF